MQVCVRALACVACARARLRVCEWCVRACMRVGRCMRTCAHVSACVCARVCVCVCVPFQRHRMTSPRAARLGSRRPSTCCSAQRCNIVPVAVHNVATLNLLQCTTLQRCTCCDVAHSTRSNSVHIATEYPHTAPLPSPSTDVGEPSRAGPGQAWQPIWVTAKPAGATIPGSGQVGKL